MKIEAKIEIERLNWGSTIKAPVEIEPQGRSFYMNKVNNILKSRTLGNNDNIDIKPIVNNDIIDGKRKNNKYSLDKNLFTPNTEESQLAEEIAIYFDDLENYAFYFKVVNKLGISRTRTFWKTHKQEEEEKRGTKYEFRNSKKYFAWKFKKGIC